MTLAELVEAYKHDDSLTPMMIDNDYVSVHKVAKDDENWERAIEVYNEDPHELLEQALDLLGIPHEHV